MGDPAQSLGLLSIFLCSSCVQSPAFTQHPGLGGATPLSQQRPRQARFPLPPTPENLQCVLPAGHQQWAVPGCARDRPSGLIRLPGNGKTPGIYSGGSARRIQSRPHRVFQGWLHLSLLICGVVCSGWAWREVCVWGNSSIRWLTCPRPQPHQGNGARVVCGCHFPRHRKGPWGRLLIFTCIWRKLQSVSNLRNFSRLSTSDLEIEWASNTMFQPASHM